jgi:hypothetical protein
MGTSLPVRAQSCPGASERKLDADY